MSEHKVFVSYSRDDREKAERLITALNARGCRVWWDDAISAGARFDIALDQALNDSFCVVVLWSGSAIHSEWVKMEAQHGLARDHLIPVFVETVDLPQPFDRLQTTNLSDWDGTIDDSPVFNRLVQDIDRVVRSSMDRNSKNIKASSSSDRPGIAILPLDNRSNDEDEVYLGSAISEDIISRLQAFRTLPVISSRSSFAHSDKGQDLKEVAASLGARYIVAGSVRKRGAKVRIAVELIDTDDDQLMWSENFQREEEDIFDLQDKISLEIAARIEPEIARSERKKTIPEQIDSLSTWQLLRRAEYHQQRLNPSDAKLARDCLSTALASEPDSVDGLCLDAWQYFWDISARHESGDQWKKLEEKAQYILSLEPKQSQALNLLGIATMMDGRPRQSRGIFAESIRLNPSYSSALANLGSTFYLCGEPEEGIPHIEKSLKLNPYDMHTFHAYGELAHCHFLLCNWDEALVAVGRSLRLRRNYWLAHALRAAILARAGRINEATEAFNYFLLGKARLTLKDIHWIAYEDKKQHDYLVDSLKIAGWQ